MKDNFYGYYIFKFCLTTGKSQQKSSVENFIFSKEEN